MGYFPPVILTQLLYFGAWIYGARQMRYKFIWMIVEERAIREDVHIKEKKVCVVCRFFYTFLHEISLEIGISSYQNDQLSGNGR